MDRINDLLKSFKNINVDKNGNYFIECKENRQETTENKPSKLEQIIEDLKRY